jgi:hypothetical protein
VISSTTTRVARASSKTYPRRYRPIAIAPNARTIAADQIRALSARLVDRCHMFLSPVSVGGGTPALPTNVCLGLELLDDRRLGSGTVHLRYRIDPAIR